jgi:hypothetical protein
MTPRSNDAAYHNPFLPLTRSQIARLTALGIAGWLSAALLLRTLEPFGVFDGMARVYLYALIVPGTVLFLLLAFWLSAVETAQRALAAALMTATAAILDGVALAWTPALYGADASHVAASGAAILWGAGVALFLGMFMNRNRNL